MKEQEKRIAVLVGIIIIGVLIFIGWIVSLRQSLSNIPSQTDENLEQVKRQFKESFEGLGKSLKDIQNQESTK